MSQFNHSPSNSKHEYNNYYEEKFELQDKEQT